MIILPKGQRIRNKCYILPNILRSYEDLQRFFNRDLPEMDDFSLRQESFKVKMALAFIAPERQPWLFAEPGKLVPAVEWLRIRQAAIWAERKRREKTRA